MRLTGLAFVPYSDQFGAGHTHATAPLWACTWIGPNAVVEWKTRSHSQSSQ